MTRGSVIGGVGGADNDLNGPFLVLSRRLSWVAVRQGNQAGEAWVKFGKMNILKMLVGSGVGTLRDLSSSSSMWSVYEAELITLFVWAFQWSLMPTGMLSNLAKQTVFRSDCITTDFRWLMVTLFAMAQSRKLLRVY